MDGHGCLDSGRMRCLAPDQGRTRELAAWAVPTIPRQIGPTPLLDPLASHARTISGAAKTSEVSLPQLAQNPIAVEVPNLSLIQPWRRVRSRSSGRAIAPTRAASSQLVSWIDVVQRGKPTLSTPFFRRDRSCKPNATGSLIVIVKIPPI